MQSDEHWCQIDVTFHLFRNALYWFSSVIHEQLNDHNISEKGVRTIHKAKVYTSFKRPEQGVRLIYGCVLYTRNYGNWIFHLLIIPMTLFNDIMPYFDRFIPVYGWNMSILWSPIKVWTPKNFTTANFRHPVSKSWLRHCPQVPPGSPKNVLVSIWNTY